MLARALASSSQDACARRCARVAALLSPQVNIRGARGTLTSATVALCSVVDKFGVARILHSHQLRYYTRRKGPLTPSHIARMGLLSFLFGCGSSTGPYHKKDGSWFWKDDQMSVGADKVLTRLSDEFATVNSSAFYRGDVIPGSDATTFVVISEWLAKDKAHVYFCDTYTKTASSGW